MTKPSTATLDQLADIAAIKQAKYTYLRCIDTKDWKGLAEVVAPDIKAAYSGGKYSFSGAAELVDFLDTNMGRDSVHSSHRVHHPEIELDGDSARATWALEDTLVDTQWNFVLMGAAFYEDLMERRDGDWLIAETTYKRTFEFTFPTSSIEGFKLTASLWGSGGQSSLPIR